MEYFKPLSNCFSLHKDLWNKKVLDIFCYSESGFKSLNIKKKRKTSNHKIDKKI